MSQERSISSDSLLDLRQSYYSLNLDQSADQINLDGLNLNESSSETDVQMENRGVSVISLLNDNQTVYFHPSFLHLNTDQPSNQLTIADANSIELSTLSTLSNPMESTVGTSEANDNNQQHGSQEVPGNPESSRTNGNQANAQTSGGPDSSGLQMENLRNLLNFKTSFEWEMYSDRNQVLKELRKNRKFVDVQLIAADGYSEYAHSTVVSALGEGLANRILASRLDDRTPCVVVDSGNLQNHIKQIHLRDLSGPVLKVIVNCAYTGYIETDDKQVVWSIIEVAERFAMHDVVKACCSYLIYQLSIDNCIKLFHLGIKFKHKLRTAAWNFIRLKFDRIVNECADYIHLSVDELTGLLKDDHLNTVTGEQIVWQAICRWILADLFNRANHLNRLLEKLRFGRLPLEYLEEVVVKEPLLIEINNGTFSRANNEGISLINEKTASTNEKPGKSSGLIASGKQDTGISGSNTFVIQKIGQDNMQTLNFDETSTAKCLSLVKRMLCIRKNIKNQYKTDNRGLLVDLNPYFVRPRISAEVIFVIGGWQDNMITTLIETYDVRTNMWLESHISLKYTRAYHGLEVLNGYLYVIGGTNGNKTLSSMHCFDPNNGKWYERANMYERRCYVNTTILNDLIYAMGGHNGAQRLNTVEKYDYRTNQWTQSSPMNLARSDASAATYGNRIYIAGGLNEHVQNTVEFYNPEDDSWTFVQPMQYQRNSLSLVFYAGYLFALGGTNGSSRLNTVERYDFNTNNWTLSKPMKCSRSTFSACVLEDKLYVVGGHNQHSQIESVEYYDVQTDQWYDAKGLKRSRSGFNLCCYKSFAVSSRFTYSYAEQQKMLKNKKNLLKKKDANKASEYSRISALNNRVNRKELHSSLPTHNVNRFRRRANQYRLNNIYSNHQRHQRNPEPTGSGLESSSVSLINRISTGSTIGSTTTVDSGTAAALSTMNDNEDGASAGGQESSYFVNGNPLASTNRQNEIVIHIDGQSNATSNSAPIESSGTSAGNAASGASESVLPSNRPVALHHAAASGSQYGLPNGTQSGTPANPRPDLPSSSRNEAMPVDPSTSLLHVASFPNFTRHDSSSSTASSTDLQLPSTSRVRSYQARNQFFQTRSLNNERLVDQDETEDDALTDFDHRTI